MQWDFEGIGIDIVFSGHEHLYERLEVGGMDYVISGAGGYGTDTFGRILPGSKVRLSGVDGAVRAVVDSTTFKYDFVDTSGAVRDSHTYSKGGPQTTVPSPAKTVPPLPKASPPTVQTSSSASSSENDSTSGSTQSCAPLWTKCGGRDWSGPTCCQTGTCRIESVWYSGCWP